MLYLIQSCGRTLCVLPTTHLPAYSSAFRHPHVSHPASTTPKAHLAPTTLTDLSLPAYSSPPLSSPCSPDASSLNAASSLCVSSAVLSAGQEAPRLWLILSDRLTNWLTSAHVFSGHRLRPSKTAEFSPCLFIHRDTNFNQFLSVL